MSYNDNSTSNSNLDRQPLTQEAAGPVASDSLAADSYHDDGKFAANRDAAPSSVRGDQSTFANTDISGASILHAAPDRDARDGEEGKSGEGFGGSGNSEQRDGDTEDGGIGGKSEGDGSRGQGRDEDEDVKDDGYGGKSGGSGGGSKSRDGDDDGYGAVKDTNDDEYGSKGGRSGDDSSGDKKYISDSRPTDSGPTDDYTSGLSSDPRAESRETAPSYVESVTGGFRPASDFVPKGQGLKEGGFDADEAKNASFDAEIGSENDPSREAEKAFRKNDARIPGVVAGGDQSKHGNEQGGYESLKGDEPA